MANLARFYEIRKIMRYLINSLGLVGNTLMFVIYSQANLRKLSVSIYFRCVAVICACQNAYYLISLDLWNELAAEESSVILCKLINYANKLSV